MTTSVLVAGATGTQGGTVVDHLLAAGEFEVHALTRRPESERARDLVARGATVVQGDLAQKRSLEPLVEDVDAVFLVTDFWEHGYEGEVQQGTNMAEVAVDAGIDHLVYTSVEGAARDPDVVHVQSKYAVEQRIRELDLPATIIRLTFFMQNFEGMRDDIRAGTLPLALDPHVPLQLIDVDDLGALVAEAFAAPATYVGEDIDLAGDELTLGAMAIRFADVTGVDVRAKHLSVEALRAGDADGDEQYSWLKDEAILDLYEWFNEEGYDAPMEELRATHDVAFTRLDEYLEHHGWRDIGVEQSST